MKKYLFLLLILFSGFLCYTLRIETKNVTVNHSTNKEYKIDYDEIKVIDTGFDFLDIFINNLIVGFLLSIFGFLSGGLITVLILFWNGYLLGIVYNLAYKVLNLHEIIYLSKHIPLEILALILFSIIGIRGFFFQKKIILHKKVNFQILPKINEFKTPILLLFIASLIETI